MNKRTVHLENNPDPGTLALMLAHVSEGYLTHAVEVRRGGEPVAVLLDPEAARCALAIADRLRTRQPPFTQAALDRWLDDVLAGVDVSEFMSVEL